LDGSALARTSLAQRHLFYDIVWPKQVRKTGDSRGTTVA
jgi:hypothetical protein